MLSRKYYIMIAKLIKDNTIVNDKDMIPNNKINKMNLIMDLCGELKKDNKLFNSKRFIVACDVADD